MAFDNSRYTFDPTNDYSGVVMQQGRVQLDSDWNEWLAELRRRAQAGTLDILGRAVYPVTTPFAFLITASSSGGKNTISIGPGRLYVDGLLAENHGTPSTAVWDPALEEPSNAPQPPPSSETGAIDYASQRYLPDPPPIEGNGPFLVYLDVWTRSITYLQDQDLVDKAVGIDTAGRLQTVWQVKWMPVAAGTSCASPVTWPPSSAGLLTTGAVVSTPSGPCCLSSETGFTGQENQLYRVEIHQAGSPSASPAPTPLQPGTATFKWSRDNASVMAGVTAIATVMNSAGQPVSQLTVTSLGRDQVLGFAPGNWIEILDDSLELNGRPGELHQIDSIDFSAKTITLTAALSGSFPITDRSHTRIRRWDQSGKVYLSDGTTVWWDLDAAGTGDIPVPPSGTTLILENGITVSFDLSSPGGSFLTGDFWMFAARTADGSIEPLAKAPPRGIHHHYAQLSIVTFSPLSNLDCRTPWPPSSTTAKCGCCCTVTVGDGVESTGQFTSIQAAVQSLPALGGRVCILPGRYFEHVFIEDRTDVVIRGCGAQTRIASPSLAPAPNPNTARPATAAPANQFAAVITIAGSRHITLEDFAVEAADGEVGVLIDGTGTLAAPPPSPAPQARTLDAALEVERRDVIDTILTELVITASTRPAILANRAQLLEIEKCRLAMENVQSQWPAVWVGGTGIRILRNWVGAQGTAAATQWVPAAVAADLASSASANTAPFLNPGGIQVAGPSQGVYILENRIEDSGRNGISLGSLAVLDGSGGDTGILLGVLTADPGQCPGPPSLQPGPPPSFSQPGSTVAAGGPLKDIQIDRNLIRNTGLCGIGPVAFFDLRKILEVITIENLTIGSNTITDAVQAAVAALSPNTSIFAYGAICLPDVENLTIHDNAISNYGSAPGLDICGIFILHAEMVDISRNQVLETRDWASGGTDTSSSGFRAGICTALVSPPSFIQASTFTKAATIYEPGLPALRIEHNSVRVAAPQALIVEGFGPFAILNNHFACGGTLVSSGTPGAETVLIFNLGPAIESAGRANTFSELYANSLSSTSGFQTNTLLTQSSGTVVFTNNLCHLEAQVLGQHAISNVLILTHDSLIFNGNHCWIDGPTLSAAVDALLVAGSLQVANNRFQEAPAFCVLASGVTVGVLNVTCQNISTYCLYVEGGLTANANNLSVIPATACSGNLRGQ